MIINWIENFLYISHYKSDIFKLLWSVSLQFVQESRSDKTDGYW